MSSKQLRDLLEDKAYVDYFNVFLSQPIFAFRIMYRFHERNFAVDTRLGLSLEKITKSKLLDWLESERIPLFVQSSMYFEYKLCTQLRELQLNKETFSHTCGYGHLDEAAIKLIVENIFGHYVGMQQFKKFITETNGEKVWQCIHDVMLYCNKKRNDKLKRYELHHFIMKYLANGAFYEVSNRLKLHLFLDSDHLNNLSVEDAILDGATYHECLFHNDTLSKDPEKAMLRFQGFLVQDILNYWAPCFVLHLLQKRISYNLDCLCQLRFTETAGSLINIMNLFDFPLFDFPSRNCLMFMSEEGAQETSQLLPRVRPVGQPKLSVNIREHLFGDELVSETVDSINHEMVTILTSDKLSGYPFYNFLMQTNETNEDMLFLLWEDLCKYINMGSNSSAGEYAKRLQEIKITNVYLMKERKPQDDMLDEIIKDIPAFEIGDAKEKKIANLLKARNKTTDILQKSWQKFIDYEKNRIKDIFNCPPSESSEENIEDECDAILDVYKSYDQTSMVESSLALIDIKQLKQDHFDIHNMLPYVLREDELNKISLLRIERQRSYQLGKDIFKLLKSTEKKIKHRPMKKIYIPKAKQSSIPFKNPEPQIHTLKLLFDLRAKVRGIKTEHVKERPKIRTIGVNPYLSLRKMDDAPNIIDFSKKRRIMFQKYGKILCQFLYEMCQPYMKILLTAYVDRMSKNPEFQMSEQRAAERYSRYTKRKLNRQVTVFNTPPPIYYARLKKKIIYLSESLRFKMNAHELLKSGKRSKINLLLKNKARHIIITFQEGSLFTKDKSDFVFGCSMSPIRDLANDVAMRLKNEGASCALFHKLDLQVIPIVYQIWKRMGMACMHCGGRQIFLAALGIDRVAFDKKVAASKKLLKRIQPEKGMKFSRMNKRKMEQQASLLASSLLAFFDENSDGKFERTFAYNIVECLSPDLRKLIQHRGGSQLEYVLVR